MNLVLLGAPGAGKGTQADKIAQKYGFLHISTGDIIRDNVVNNTKDGIETQKYVDQGKLVPDELMIKMVEEYLKNIAWSIIWDGFPRTIAQADKLDKILENRNQHVDLVLYLKISEDKIIDRIKGRLVCMKCKRTFHVTARPPKIVGVCDFDHQPLIKRSDDNEEKARVRIKAYCNETEPLIEYYQTKQVLKIIDSDQNENVVWTAIIQEIQKYSLKE